VDREQPRRIDAVETDHLCGREAFLRDDVLQPFEIAGVDLPQAPAFGRGLVDATTGQAQMRSYLLVLFCHEQQVLTQSRPRHGRWNRPGRRAAL
jgi:hypothetical protein